MFVTVLIINCHVSEKEKIGPETIHTITKAQATIKALGAPETFAI